MNHDVAWCSQILEVTHHSAQFPLDVTQHYWIRGSFIYFSCMMRWDLVNSLVTTQAMLGACEAWGLHESRMPDVLDMLTLILPPELVFRPLIPRYRGTCTDEFMREFSPYGVLPTSYTIAGLPSKLCFFSGPRMMGSHGDMLLIFPYNFISNILYRVSTWSLQI